MLAGLSGSGDALILLGGGLLGAYTTFSTWMVEAIDRGGASYLALSMGGGLAAAGLGWIIGGAL